MKPAAALENEQFIYLAKKIHLMNRNPNLSSSDFAAERAHRRSMKWVCMDIDWSATFFCSFQLHICNHIYFRRHLQIRWDEFQAVRHQVLQVKD